MAVLAECPICRRKQSAKNKVCKCGEDLDKAKRSKKVEFWIDYRVPGGRQLRQRVGTSIEEARDADGKRRMQKREHRIFDMLPEATMTFRELADWYLSLEKVKALASHKTVKTYLDKFNKEFGDTIVNTVKASDLENHQVMRKNEGNKPKTVDDELNYAKGMIIKAFNDNKVGGDVLKTFRNIEMTLEGHANRRERVLTVHEFETLIQNAPQHLKGILVMGYWTGMRKGEILNLTWDKIDMRNRMIRLGSADTKEGMSKTMPIGEAVHTALSGLPRGIHSKVVFLYNGKAIQNRFETAIKSTCAKAKIKWGREEPGGFIFHDLRHTFITDMRRAGVNRNVTMSITGHAIQDMNQRYDTIEDRDKLEAIKELESYRRNEAANVDQTVDQTAPDVSNVLKFNK